MSNVGAAAAAPAGSPPKFSTPMTPSVTCAVDEVGIAWIGFNAGPGRLNVMDAGMQAGLSAALEETNSPRVKAVVIISDDERSFLAGADLKLVGALRDVPQAVEFSRRGQELFQRLASSAVPVVCAIHGACAGGGYELALACHWRIASDARTTRIGLPEVGLGTVPGWGGCIRLPRLIGAAAALDHLLKARLLAAGEALAAGLVDEVVPATDLKTRAQRVAQDLAAHGRQARSHPPVPASVWFGELIDVTKKKTGGRLPAPLAVIEVVQSTLKLELAPALEREALAFGRLTTGSVCKNLIRGFFLREAAKKRTLEGWFSNPPLNPAPIRRVGIVGAGVMGSGIAQALAAKGLPVVLRDVRPDCLQRGLAIVGDLFADAVMRGTLSAAEAEAGHSRIAGTTGWEGFATCDLIIEAIVEDLGAKQALFREIAAIVPPSSLLVSNTSALPIEEIAGNIPHLDRTLGLHFFNPVSRMPLVELIVGRHTSADAAQRALMLVRMLGKSPVICRSVPGFLVTRVLFFYLNAAVRGWEDGVPAASLDGALRKFGWPMGPLRLIDEIGVDVTAAIFRELAYYFPERFVPTATCGVMVAAGLNGRKQGAGTGFYRYDAGQEAVNESALPRSAGFSAKASPPPEIIAERLMRVMIDEAQRCLHEGVVRTVDDIDFALLAGTGFPAFRGGLMQYARELNRAAVPTSRQSLQSSAASAPTPLFHA